MAGNEVKLLYSTSVAVVGLICFVVGASAVGIPMWGYFGTPRRGHELFEQRGYFGPWQICIFLMYNRVRCGPGDSRFKPSGAVWVAGLVACLGAAVLGVFCILSVYQLAMISFKKKVILKYRSIVLIKVVLSFVSALLATVATSLFATQGYDWRNDFEVIRGPGFYMEVLAIILNSILFVVSLYDMLLARREGGDATTTAMPVELTTHLNPGPGKEI